MADGHDGTIDPLADALAGLERALVHDAVTPADLLAEVDAQLRAVEAALVPRRRTKATKAAEAALTSAREKLRKRGLEALKDVRDAEAAFRVAHELPRPPKPRMRYGLAATLEDLPPPKTICARLEWDVGRPPMVIGPPGAAKTYAVQAAVLDLVLGRPLWGHPDFRPPGPCRCLHVDLDQGRRKTLRRYKRLLRGLGVVARDPREARQQLAAVEQIEPHELGSYDVDEGEGLVLGSLQPEEIMRWRAAWLEAVRGYDVAFVDSLRRLAPFLDENDSRFSIVPDALRFVSEAADVVFVLLHHSTNKGGRPGERPQGKPAPGTRGTSAIDGAAGTQLAIEKDKDMRRVTQIRAGEAAELDAFYLAFENDEESGPKGIRGVRLRYRSIDEAKAPEKAAKSARLRELMDKCLLYIRETNLRKHYGPMRKQVVGDVEGNDKGLYAALDKLVQEKLVRETKDGKVMRLWAADVTAPSAPGGDGS